jgi:hypothetical protein
VNLRLLGALQWVGLLLGAGAWLTAHLVGIGVTQAECGAGAGSFGISNDLWQGLIMGFTVALLLVAEAAAVAVFTQTRGANFGDGPPGEGRFHGELPQTRIHFFATAAILANAIFLLIVVLDGTAVLVHGTCTQA